MFAKRAHHRLPRPVGLPPRYLRASATTFDEVKLEAIAPPAGVTVAFDPTPASAATLACAVGKTARLHLRDPRAPSVTCARPAGAGATTADATDARLAAALGEPKPPGRNHLGAASMKLGLGPAKPPACMCGAPTLPARHPTGMAMVAIGVMMLGMMAGVIGRGVSPCAMVRPCRSWRDKYDDGRRTQCQLR
jgi:hypothetical protein